MKPSLAIPIIAGLLVSPALAQQKTQQTPTPGSKTSALDLDKVGPWTRKPTKEKQTEKEITQFFDQEEALMKKGDFDAMVSRVDFPVFMITDDSKGIPKAKEYDRPTYEAMMRPMMENWPKDAVVTHRPVITVLSDSLVTYVDSFTMTTKGVKRTAKSSGTLVKRDGQWKWKAMVEAGWGDVPESGVGGAGTPSPDEQPAQPESPKGQ